MLPDKTNPVIMSLNMIECRIHKPYSPLSELRNRFRRRMTDIGGKKRRNGRHCDEEWNRKENRKNDTRDDGNALTHTVY